MKRERRRKEWERGAKEKEKEKEMEKKEKEKEKEKENENEEAETRTNVLDDLMRDSGGGSGSLLRKEAESDDLNISTRSSPATFDISPRPQKTQKYNFGTHFAFSEVIIKAGRRVSGALSPKREREREEKKGRETETEKEKEIEKEKEKGKENEAGISPKAGITPKGGIGLTPGKLGASSKWRVLKDAGTPARIRARVQKRLQFIIATEVAGKHGSLLIDGDSITIEIEGFSSVLSKWLIPRGAKHAFRAVAFEAIVEIGERDFALQGEHAFGKIDAEDLAMLMAPLLACMGTYETMGEWLKATTLIKEFEAEGDEITFDTGEGGKSDSTTAHSKSLWMLIP